jgi:CheY-like chemotaxis protein
MNDVVSKMTDMLGRLLGEDIALQVNYFPGRAMIQADASMIEQVLLNLAVNSRDAMPQGGVLAVGISVMDLETRDCLGRAEARAGRFVCLTVSDRGCGIPEQNLPHLFEPFFTTKEVGKGTGLGLATVYGIVKQHQGWIEVESRVKEGATFKVFLPWMEQTQQVEEGSRSEVQARGGSETILVVEDEAPVRELVCELLGAYGYKVIAAESGAKALELWPSCREKIDLMLTDLVMPDRVNGRQLAEKLRVDRPGLKVIFTSGYSAEVVGQDLVLQSGVQYLQKPYAPNRLATKVGIAWTAVARATERATGGG